MKGRWLEVLWLLAWGAASSIWCVTAAERLGATFDEPLYLRRGLERWRSGSYAGLMKLGTMPLPIDVETLPLYLWERIRGEAFDPIVDLPRLLPIARAANLVFWWLLLVYAWRLGAALGGRWAGLGAVALLACEPTVLAHASLATTDLSITACTLALVYHARQGLAGGWRRRVGWPAFWWAACLLAKASALVFGPLCLLVVELEQRGRRWVGAPLVGQPRSLKELAQVGAIGLVLVFAYCGTDWQPEPSFVDWARGLPESRAGRTLRWGAENLRIFSNAGEGLIRQVRHNIRGHSYGTYLLGEAHPRSVWYYFPVALSMKLSPVLLLLPGVFLLLRPGALLNTAFMGACVLLAYSLNCRVQIGVRLMLPLVALAAVGLAAAAVAAAAGPPGRRRGVAALVSAGVLFSAASAWAVWPHGLCYVNPFWGGTAAGYRCLSDSNYDWGQGLKELAAWQARQGGRLEVWYFGTDPAIASDPFEHRPLHVRPWTTESDVQRELAGRRLAVSTTLLFGPPITPAHRLAADFLRRQQPVARTTTFWIYDLTREEAALPAQP